MRAFKPSTTVNIDVSSSSQRVAYSPLDVPQTVRVMNDGTATVWIIYGGSGVTAATATSMPVAAGGTELLTFVGGYVAAIAAGSTGKIYFTPGEGI